MWFVLIIIQRKQNIRLKLFLSSLFHSVDRIEMISIEVFENAFSQLFEAQNRFEWKQFEESCNNYLHFVNSINMWRNLNTSIDDPLKAFLPIRRSSESGGNWIDLIVSISWIELSDMLVTIYILDFQIKFNMEYKWSPYLIHIWLYLSFYLLH